MRNPYQRTAAREETAEYDADVRRRESIDGNFPAVCHSEPETITILSSG